MSFTTPDESTRIGDETALELFPMEIFGEFDEQLLFMQLYRAVGLVLATKEAMWDELKERLKRERGSLAEYGWRDEEFLEDVSRRKFDALVERYKGYVSNILRVPIPTLFLRVLTTQGHARSNLPLVLANEKWLAIPPKGPPLESGAYRGGTLAKRHYRSSETSHQRRARKTHTHAQAHGGNQGLGSFGALIGIPPRYVFVRLEGLRTWNL